MLFGSLGENGIIRNLKICLSFYYQNDQSENENHEHTGGLVGNLNGGTIQNCYIKLIGDSYTKFYAKTNTSSNKVRDIGCVAGKYTKGTIKQTTVDLNGHSLYAENLQGQTKWGASKFYPYYRACVGGFCGSSDSDNYCTYNNIKLKGD